MARKLSLSMAYSNTAINSWASSGANFISSNNYNLLLIYYLLLISSNNITNRINNINN